MKENINILVVDDDPQTIRSAWKTLGPSGYNVEGVLSAKEAMHRIKHNNYALVFTDLSMPETDGITLIQWIRQHRPAMGIVVIISSLLQKNIEEALKFGINEHVLKPFAPEKLKAVTRKTIEWISIRASENGQEEEFPPAKLAELDKVINRQREEPGSTIRVLLSAQEIFGYLPLWILRRISRGLNVYLSEITSLVSFYPFFRTKPGGEHVPCYMNGSEKAWQDMSWMSWSSYFMRLTGTPVNRDEAVYSGGIEGCN